MDSSTLQFNKDIFIRRFISISSPPLQTIYIGERMKDNIILVSRWIYFLVYFSQLPNETAVFERANSTLNWCIPFIFPLSPLKNYLLSCIGAPLCSELVTEWNTKHNCPSFVKLLQVLLSFRIVFFSLLRIIR